MSAEKGEAAGVEEQAALRGGGAAGAASCGSVRELLVLAQGRDILGGEAEGGVRDGGGWGGGRLLLGLGLAVGRVRLGCWLLLALGRVWRGLLRAVLLLWRRTGAGRWVVRHAAVRRIGCLAWARSLAGRWAVRVLARSLARLGLRVMGVADGGEAGGTGTCAAVDEAAHHHRACARGEEVDGRGGEREREDAR